MKRIALVFALITVMLTCSIPVNADMGIPQTSEFTVAINLDGCSTYKDYDKISSNSPTGHFDGGIAFYVYDSYDGYYYGTTETPKNPQNYDGFVFIYESDAINSSENIPPETGEDTGYTIDAETNDALNLRTGPGIGFKVKKVLPKGEPVTYTTTIQTDGEWAYVSAGSDYGWASVKYLDIKKKTETGATNSEPKAEPSEGHVTEKTTPDTQEEDVKEENKYLIPGIICICVGAALLIAAIALYVLKKRKNV